MHIIAIALIFLLAVVASVFISRLLPVRIPLPIIQIILGALLSIYGFEIEFDPHVFLLLFIPPLLFLDGWRIPKDAFFSELKPIMSLAIGLVIFTVIGVGLFINWLIPTMTLAVAFALAAILSPTDPVSVSAMTINSPLPSRMAHILEGESMLNDATGLVCFSFAVTAALTGTFSLSEAALEFLLVAGGGVLLGLIVTLIIGWLNHILVKRVGEDPAIQILISLLIPFTAYLVAEHFYVSGILAAAVAGIAMHYEELTGRLQAITRMQRNAVWNMVQVTLNGIIFILLGEQLPHMWGKMPQVARVAGINEWILLGYIVTITIALLVLRFIWGWLAFSFTIFRDKSNKKKKKNSHTRIIAVMATAGVRGSITLAGILTLPLFMPDGADFPSRDIAIFLAMGVILLSLIFASIGLPLLTRGLVIDLPHKETDISARVALAEAAINRIKEIMNNDPSDDSDKVIVQKEVGSRLLEAYANILDYGDTEQKSSTDIWERADLEHKLRREALRAERSKLGELRKNKDINDELHRKLLNELDLKEEILRQR